MSHKPVISVEQLAKRYRIGELETYRSLREAIPATARRLMRRGRAPGEGSRRTAGEFWALRDVSFDVQEGEVVGVIGRNGAGKSTLLKILSRITEPTEGCARIRGRVSSLLEVGTGFHPELTGRENVYLNGSILGMTRQEIRRKFDEIVAFSGVEQFLDTPVKRYSSGMSVRLAFAVAAHLEPEVLIIDEVLAVGDAEFQRRCIGKMSEAARSGRTILFVSHNMAAVQNLCTRGVFLQSGQVAFCGATADAISIYLANDLTEHDGFVPLNTHSARRDGCIPLLQSVRFIGADEQQRGRVSTGERLVMEFTLHPQSPLQRPTIGIGVDDAMGVRVFSLATYLSDSEIPRMTQPTVVRCTVESLPLVPGRYSLSLSAGEFGEPLLDAIDNAVCLDVEAADFYGNGACQPASLGRVAVRSKWEVS